MLSASILSPLLCAPMIASGGILSGFIGDSDGGCLWRFDCGYLVLLPQTGELHALPDIRHLDRFSHSKTLLIPTMSIFPAFHACRCWGEGAPFLCCTSNLLNMPRYTFRYLTQYRKDVPFWPKLAAPSSTSNTSHLLILTYKGA